MGAINIGARNGGRVKVVAPDNPAVGAEAILPKKSGTLATLEDISNITDLDAEALVHLADQVEENKQDIVELEEEIEAIAPSFDRGEWDFHEPETLPAIPDTKTYYILNEAGGVPLLYSQTHKIVFSNLDVNDDNHTWLDIEVGQYLEMFDERDGEFLLAKVDAITLETAFATFEVTVQKSDGGPRGVGGDDEVDHRVRVKFFELEGAIDLDTLMPKSGGVFTGAVTHKKEIFIEPTMPNRWVDIKNRYSTNADGSSPGAQGQGFGVNFDLDHGNSGYNQVRWSNRNGDILNISGGTQANAKYTGAMTEGSHLVNKRYVETYSLTSGPESYRKKGGESLGDNQFGAVGSSVGSTSVIFLNKLFLNDNENTKPVKNYEATDNTWFEVYKNSVLILRMQIKRDSWQPSIHNANQIQCSGAYPYPLMGLSENWSGTTNYKIALTGLRKVQQV